MEQPNDDRLRQLLLLLERWLCLWRALLRNGNADSERRMASRADRQSCGEGEQSMGDIIKLKKITLLYGHLYQIDYYNETKGDHGRMFIEKEQINNAEIADDDVVLQNNTILSVCGEPFHCPVCMANVFSKVKKANGDIVYRCHGCDTEYAGE